MSQDPAIAQLPDPIKNDELCVHDVLVFQLFGTKHSELIDDILLRKTFGIEKYGVPLQPNNGRPALVDAYQELLDATVYVCQKALESGDPSGDLADAQLHILAAASLLKLELEVEQNGQ